MNEIYNPPNDYGFGLDFSYASWEQGTRVTLVNVPWDNTYRDIVKFADRTALNSYITSIENAGVTINDVSYAKPSQGVIRLELPFNSANRFNYLRASNPLQPVNGDISKDYYYFITEVRYLNPSTTEFVLQLDVWQTFGFDVSFGNSYIEKGHIGIANSKAFDNYGRDYLTIPEGLDIGAEYLQVARRSDTILDVDNADILVVSSIALEEELGTSDDPSPVKTAKGSKTQGLVSGASFYIFSDHAHFYNFMVAFSEKPWVTQGILSITMIPELSRYQYGIEVAGENLGIPLYKLNIVSGNASRGKYTSMFDNWRESTEINELIPERYRHLKKFFTYPYMVIEMTTWGGTPIIIKPESWADDDATINEKASLSPPNQRVVIYPRRYNAKKNSTIDNMDNGVFGDSHVDYGDDGGDYLDKATMIANFPTLAIVNNMAINYLASNAHGIAFANQSADWSQQRALQSNQVSYDQQSAGIEMSKNINKMERLGASATVGNDQLAMLQANQISMGAGLINTGVGMAGSGGAGSMAASGISGVTNAIAGSMQTNVSVDRSTRNLAVANSVSQTNNTLGTNQQALMRDTNKNLADWAARGDYENSISGINAKVQDAMLTPPSTSGQVGGEAFNMIHGAAEVSLRWKMISPAEMRAVGEIWLRYGYSVRQFALIPNTLMVMTKFTYWKLSETYITAGAMPEYFKHVIRGIFEKGVTVWGKPEYIGNTDLADNEPLENITL